MYTVWTQRFPGITPFYAIKCNPDHGFIQTLAELEAKPPEAERPEAEPTPAPDDTTDTSEESETAEPDASLSAAARAECSGRARREQVTRR